MKRYHFRRHLPGQPYSRWDRWWGRKGSVTLTFGLLCCVLYVAAFLFAELAYPLGLYPYSPSSDAIDYQEADLPPSHTLLRSALDFRGIEYSPDTPLSHPLGTDQEGRDILIRTAKGATVSIQIGSLSVVLMIMLGVLLGSLRGYYPSSSWDAIATFAVNVIESPPRLVVLFIVAAASNFDMLWFAVTLGILNGARASHVVYNRTASLRTTGFIEAARELGLSDLVIIGKHIIWYNCREILALQICFAYVSAVLVEATLGYMEYGLPPRYVSWGRMLSEGLGGVARDQYWQFIPPAAALALTLLGLTLLADGLGRRFNIRTTDYL